MDYFNTVLDKLFFLRAVSDIVIRFLSDEEKLKIVYFNSSRFECYAGGFGFYVRFHKLRNKKYPNTLTKKKINK